jgi:cytochrome c-type biogenesis protein CcsB
VLDRIGHMNFVNFDLLSDLNKLDTFLANATFVALLGTMIIYWVDTAFFQPPRAPHINMGILPPANSKLSRGTPGAREGSTQNNMGGKYNIGSAGAQGYPDKDWEVAGQFATKNLFGISLGQKIMFISNLSLVLLLLVRWENAGHFPLSNLYESLMFLAWCCTFLHLIFSKSFSIYIEKILGSIIAPCALLMNAFANFTLPKEMQHASPLVPALQSNWLMMHVTVMIISYATLIIGSLLSIAFLILSKLAATQSNISKREGTYVTALSAPQLDVEPQKVNEINYSGGTPAPNLGPAHIKMGDQDHQRASANNSALASPLKNIIINLDFLSYRIIGLGFPFLTVGILSGAVWANEAWGSYWSWDPKETWALLTWLVFAIYLHSRLNEKTQNEGNAQSNIAALALAPSPQNNLIAPPSEGHGKVVTTHPVGGPSPGVTQFPVNEKPAIIASIGFLVVWFCYLGVNLLGEGLHSYGFFKN